VAASQKVEVSIEAAAKRAFASALDWPGWCRSGRDEDAALAALAEYGQRFAAVAAAAGVPFSAGGSLVVVERAPGTATTQFGAPDVTAAADRRPLTAAQARRISALVAGSWRVLDGVVAHAPASLRKGPRGGGRDRDAIVDHVLAAEAAYARKIGLRIRQPQAGDRPAIDEARHAMLAVFEAARGGAPLRDRGWVPRYAARRIAWHVLDHAWEIEDKSER
jgi:hypothetical protein